MITLYNTLSDAEILNAINDTVSTYSSFTSSKYFVSIFIQANILNNNNSFNSILYRDINFVNSIISLGKKTFIYPPGYYKQPDIINDISSDQKLNLVKSTINNIIRNIHSPSRFLYRSLLNDKKLKIYLGCVVIQPNDFLDNDIAKPHNINKGGLSKVLLKPSLDKLINNNISELSHTNIIFTY